MNDVSRKDAPLAIFFYCLTLNGIIFMNRYIINALQFNFHYILLLTQSFISLWVLWWNPYKNCFCSKNIRDKLPLATWGCFNLDIAKEWAHVCLINVLSIYTGSKAFEHLTIPTINIFKGISLIITAVYEYAIMGAKLNNITLMSFVFIMISFLMTATSTAKDEYEGLCWITLNCVLCVAYAMCARRVSKRLNLKAYDILYYNSIVSIPILALNILFLEDLNGFVRYLERCREPLNLALCLYLYALLSTAFSFAIAWNMEVTSTVTQSVVSISNKLVVGVCSYMLFAEKSLNLPSILTGICGSILYTIGKNMDNSNIIYNDKEGYFIK